MTTEIGRPPPHYGADDSEDQRPAGPFGRGLMRVCEALALAGGLVLMVVTALTVFSVVGRTLFDAPLLGDSEVVEIGVAFSIFSFLAYCQMRDANVVIDFFTARAPVLVRDGLDVFAKVLFTAVVCLLGWRLALGGIDAYGHNDFSMFLRIPTWWGYLGAFVSCVVWAVACLYMAGRGLAAATRGGPR